MRDLVGAEPGGHNTRQGSRFMYRMRWSNDTGGDWIGAPRPVASPSSFWLDAKKHFEFEENNDDDIEIWEVDENGEATDFTPVDVWCVGNFR